MRNILSKVFEQTSFQLVGKVFSTLSTLIVLAIITRNFGEVGTGTFTLAITYLAFFFLAVDLGLNAHVIKNLEHTSSEANKLFSFRIYWSLLLVGVSILLLTILPFQNAEFNLAVVFGSLMIVCNGIFNSANLIFQSKLRYDKSIIASSLGSLAVIPLAFYLSGQKVSVGILILAMLFGWFINNLVSLFLVSKFHKFQLLKPDFKYPVQLLKQTWPISLTLLLNVIYFRVDAFILSSTKSFADVGVYNLAYQVFQNVLVLPTFIMNSFYPIMLTQYNSNTKNFYSLFRRSLLILILLSIVTSLFLYFFADLIITILAGENSFNGSSLSLQILSFSIPAFFVSALLMWFLVVLKKYKSIFVIYSIGLLVNLLLNLYLIPKYSYIGASVVTVISEYLILIMEVIILIAKQEKSHQSLIPILRKINSKI